MKKSVLILVGGLVAGMASPAFAGHRDDAALGSVLGGVVGAVVGNGMGGQQGAVMGAVIGAGAGAYIGADDHDRDRRHRDYYRGDRYDYDRGRDHRHYYREPQRVYYRHDDRPRYYGGRHDHGRHRGWDRGRGHYDRCDD